jgi:hypothetical protein
MPWNEQWLVFANAEQLEKPSLIEQKRAKYRDLLFLCVKWVISYELVPLKPTIIKALYLHHIFMTQNLLGLVKYLLFFNGWFAADFPNLIQFCVIDFLFRRKSS